MDLKANIFRVGLIDKFGVPDPVSSGNALMPLKAPALKEPIFHTSDWEYDVGTRIWFSSSTIGVPQPELGFPPAPPILVSRLTYSNLDAYSGEAFARVDHFSGFFVKGFLGAGGITGGRMNDEDFPAAGAYSNTLQSSNSGDLGYANIDLGYTFLKAPSAKLGAFVGYNYYTEHVNTYGCTQLAGADTCTPATPFPPHFIGVALDDRFSSLRVGLSAQFPLTDKLKFTADAAYLPRVNFKGQDDHNARELLLPEASSNGDGIMLEAILAYDITKHWNVGIGGRYWAWNTRDGTEIFNFLGSTGPAPSLAGAFQCGKLRRLPADELSLG